MSKIISEPPGYEKKLCSNFRGCQDITSIVGSHIFFKAALDYGETFYGSREPQWLVESPKEPQSHFDCRGCVRQIRSSSGFRNDSYVRTPGRDYERTSMVNAESRQANYVYNGAPATHRTVTDRPAFTALPNATVRNIPIVEFMVPLCCGKCEEKVKEELENVKGVYKVVCDQHNQRVTVSSTLDPQRLLKRVKRIKKNSHFWSSSSFHVPGQHQIRPYYVSPARSSYDPVETQYMKRKPQVVDPELYYAGAENQYKMSSPFRAGTPYVESSLNYGRLSSSSYGPAYEDYLEYY